MLCSCVCARIEVLEIGFIWICASKSYHKVDAHATRHQDCVNFQEIRVDSPQRAISVRAGRLAVITPVGEAKNDFNFNLENISTKERLEMRQRVINCSIEDLIRVNEKYLTKESKKSILAGEAYREEASSLGLTLREV